MTDITVSLEWAKKLRDAEWDQEDCVFFYVSNDKDDFLLVPRHYNTMEKSESFHHFSAPTAEEILRELPHVIHDKGSPRFLQCGKHKKFWDVGYWRGVEPMKNVTEDTLANAAAAMWIYLKKNNLLPSND